MSTAAGKKNARVSADEKNNCSQKHHVREGRGGGDGNKGTLTAKRNCLMTTYAALCTVHCATMSSSDGKNFLSSGFQQPVHAQTGVQHSPMLKSNKGYFQLNSER